MPSNTMPKKATPIKYTVAMSKEMEEGLEKERQARKIATIPEVIRIIVSEYFKTKSTS